MYKIHGTIVSMSRTMNLQKTSVQDTATRILQLKHIQINKSVPGLLNLTYWIFTYIDPLLNCDG